MLDRILHGDSLQELSKLEDGTIDMIITSPPYWGLRDYDDVNQLGQEDSYNDYIKRLCDIFDECKRVLKEEGTCWVNIGTTFGKDKSDAQIPSRFSIEMVRRGWLLRNEIIWHKPNAFPSSVKDRFTVDYEKLFFFVKNKKYYFEQQKEPVKEISVKRAQYGWHGTKTPHNGTYAGLSGTEMIGNRYCDPSGRNKRSVWTISSKGFKGAHFATYPEKLIEVPILAGCPPGGIVLDPFMGSGTTGVVAKRLGRHYLGIELNNEYITIANNRIDNG